MREDHPLAKRGRVAFAETLEYDHVGLHVNSSINTRMHLSARAAGRTLRVPIHVPGFDAVCRMAQVGMGIGLLPYEVFVAIGRQLGLASVELNEDWAERELKIVIRDEESLSPVTKALFAHLRSAEARAKS